MMDVFCDSMYNFMQFLHCTVRSRCRCMRVGNFLFLSTTLIFSLLTASGADWDDFSCSLNCRSMSIWRLISSYFNSKASLWPLFQRKYRIHPLNRSINCLYHSESYYKVSLSYIVNINLPQLVDFWERISHSIKTFAFVGIHLFGCRWVDIAWLACGLRASLC